MEFPATIPVSRINAKNAEWRDNHDYWNRLRKLSEGGKTIEIFAEEFLQKRAMEAPDVYADRVSRFTYINHSANITGWYGSALFKQAPSIVLRKKDATSTLVTEGPELDQLNRFIDDCDGKGNTLVDFWRKCVIPGELLYRKNYVLFDLPVAPQYTSIADQKQAGALIPHLAAWAPQDVINWQTDESGNLIWAVIKLRATTQGSPFDPISIADRWYIFTTTQVAAYEFVFPQKGATDSSADTQWSEKDYGNNAKANLLKDYPKAHSLADQQIVPLFVEVVHQDHWIGDRIASPLVRLTNMENSHDWSLEQSNLAQLVIYSDQNIDSVKKGEAHYLQFGANDKAEYLEPSGRSFSASSERIRELREDIYRLANLVMQGRSSSASAATQSGYSKEQDMLPARDVLSALGDQVRGSLQKILQTAADRMELDVAVDVQGFDFSDRSDVIELEVMEKADATTEVNSATYERERQKRTVRIAMPDANRELLQAIDKEIDTNPTPSEQQLQQQQQATSMRMAQQTKLLNPKLFSDAVEAA